MVSSAVPARAFPTLLGLVLALHADGGSAHADFALGDGDARVFMDLGSLGGEEERGGWSQGGFQASLPLAYRQLEMGLGVGFVYQGPSPVPNDGSHRWKLGLDQAYLRLPWTMGNWSGAAQAGFFPWTGNPDAALLGGYLARNGAYPGRVERKSDDWDSLGGIQTLAGGMRFLVGSPRGAWTQQVLFLLDSSASGKETDFSLAYVLDVRLPRGLEVGAGWELFRFASTGPGELAPRHARNTWIKTDSGHFLESELPPDRIPGPSEDTGHYTRSGLKLGLRAALDVRELLDLAEKPGREGRLFVEAALLGWRDQPIFYESRLHRTAVTGGAHLPSFGLLDMLCVQAEWRPIRLHWRSADLFPTWAPDGTRIELEQPDPWTFGIFLSRDMFSWLAFQGRALWLPDPGGFVSSSAANHYSAGNTVHFLFRLAARF